MIETKDGQKVQTEKRILPGYVLVNMDLNDDSWTVVKNTPGVTGFAGAGAQARAALAGATSTGSCTRASPAATGRARRSSSRSASR